MTWPSKINSGKILIFFAEKNIFKIFDTKIFIFFALNQLNMLMYSKIEFLKSILLRIIKTLSTAKIGSPEIYKGYLSNPQKHIPAKYLKKISVKIIFLGKYSIRSLNFLFQIGF